MHAANSSSPNVKTAHTPHGAVRAIIHGYVQGVGFRYSLCRVAKDSGISGWVRNQPQGTVEAWCEGNQEALEDLHSWLKRGGPPLAQISRVEWQEVAPRGYRGFKIK